MKTVLLRATLFLLIVGILVPGCKKKNKEIADLKVIPTDLVNYYIPLEIKDNPDAPAKFRVIYFTNTSDAINATYDGPDLRRGQVVTVENNIFRFDVNANGSHIHEFVFAKNSDGSLSLKSYSKQGGAGGEIIHAELIKNSNAPAWGGQKYYRKIPDSGNGNFISFSDDRIKYFIGDKHTTLVPIPQPIYTIGGSIGFKNDLQKMMGIVLPSWKGNNKLNVIYTTSANLTDFYGQP